MTERSDNLKDSSAEFLLRDIQVAMTFMDVAETAHIPETVGRNHHNARVAYDTVLKFLSTLRLEIRDRQQVETGLAVLKKRLQAVGQQF